MKRKYIVPSVDIVVTDMIGRLLAGSEVVTENGSQYENMESDNIVTGGTWNPGVGNRNANVGLWDE